MPAWIIYERLAALLEPVDEELGERLLAVSGERWLGVGPSSVALRAAAAGAQVTAVDGSELVVEKLQQDAEDAGVEVEAVLADVEYLPFDDASFDVLASRFGLVRAPDHVNVSAELARVARPGARLGFTAWRPNPKVAEIYRRFTDVPIEGFEEYEWGREDHVEDMLGEEFELDFVDGTLTIEAASADELWELFSTSSTRLALLERLDEAGVAEFRRAMVELYEDYREGDAVRLPRRYLLVLGRRR
jgi:SAM-dependent methyltransferase